MGHLDSSSRGGGLGMELVAVEGLTVGTVAAKDGEGWVDGKG
jgi:hypothetical protein